MKSNSLRPDGFTLIELLVALAIMAGAMAVIILTFTVTVRGWRRGSELLEELHHGDYVMEQLVSALRSAAFFYNDPTRFGFWLEDLEGVDYPADKISFVTAGTAFMPPGSHLANGLHRIEITVQENEDGDPAVAIRAFPHLTEMEDWEADPWFVSTVVKGLNVRTYNQQDEDWEDEWEDTNAVPSLVEVTLFMDPVDDERGDPVELSRLVEIPVAPVVQNAVAFREADEEGVAEAGAEGATATGGEAGTQPNATSRSRTTPSGAQGATGNNRPTGGAPPGGGATRLQR